VDSKGHLEESRAQAPASNLEEGGREGSSRGWGGVGGSGLKGGENEAEVSLGFDDQTSLFLPGDGANGPVSHPSARGQQAAKRKPTLWKSNLAISE
jgi:ribosomal protein L15